MQVKKHNPLGPVVFYKNSKENKSIKLQVAITQNTCGFIVWEEHVKFLWYVKSNTEKTRSVLTVIETWTSLNIYM